MFDICTSGDGIGELPVQKMSPIDMSLSQELIIDTILTEILKTDRPEFDGQRRTMDRDLINHQRELNDQHVGYCIIERRICMIL